MEMMQAKISFKRLGLGLLVFMLVTCVLQFAENIAIEAFRIKLPSAMQLPLSLAPMYLIAFPLFLGIVKTLPGAPGKASSLSVLKLLKYYIICTAIMLLGNGLSTLIAGLIGSALGRTPENALASLLVGSNLRIIFFFVVILAPVMEETIFRKILIDKSVRYGERNAVLLSALVFALFHMNLFQFFYAFGIGIVLAYIYVRTRKIRYSMLLHMLINFQGSVAPILLRKILTTEVLERIRTADLSVFTLPVICAYLYSSALLILLVVGVILLLVALIKHRKHPVLDTSGSVTDGKQIRSLTYGNAGMISFSLFCIAMMAFTLIMQMR